MTMDPRPHNQGQPAHLNELGDVLRLAVEQVRGEPVPGDRMNRTLDEARRLGPPPEPRRPWRPWAALGVTAVAALGLVGYGLEGFHWRSSSDSSDGVKLYQPSRIRTQVDLNGKTIPPDLVNVDVDAAILDGTSNSVGFYPLSQALVVRAAATIHSRSSPAEREKALNELLQEAPPEQRPALERLIHQLARTGTGAEKGPAVWHRDTSRPTLARVYVGGGKSLDMVSLHVTVTVEGPRARTVVDHVFHNPHDRQLEGTFEYPLPSGASPSYFAMFPGKSQDRMPPSFAPRGDSPPLPAAALARLAPSEVARQVDATDWGNLQEARIVPKDKALETYEEVTRQRIDPALLEYAGGNTFSGRVFPIPPKSYSRVLLAYEELLPVTGEQMVYRFPLPGRKLPETRFTLSADEKEWLQPSFLPRDAAKEEAGGRVTYSRTWKDAAPEGEVLFACTPATPRVQAVSGRQGDHGPRYLYARLRPEVPVLDKATGFASHAVFLLDTSLSEHPDRFAVSMKLLQKILETDPDIRHFNILTFNTAAAWVEPNDWLPNTAEGRDRALLRLDGLLLEGATDLSCALDKLCRPGFEVAPGTPINCFLLSDGNLTWGETDPVTLAARFEKRCPCPVRFHCYRTGLGEENAELFESLTRSGGGVLQCFGEAEVAAAARAHRSECLRVEHIRFAGGPEAADVVVAGRKAVVYPGGELVVAGRFPEAGRSTLVLEGSFQGRKVVQEFPLEITSGSELAPRAWAEVAVASLLGLHDDSLDSLVTAYCQQFGIGSRVASFLVLENETDYKRLNLEEERGKTVSGDLGAFVESAWDQRGGEITPREELDRFLRRVNRRTPLFGPANGDHVRKLLELLRDEDLALPEGELRGSLLHEKDVSPEYLAGRQRDRREVGVYLAEARRRADKGDVDGAVRALSSVVEEHPGRGDALRLAGYRLLDLRQAAHAARLFSSVQKQRPFEPHSYRDLARALEDAGRPALAALQYEIILAGDWHQRFGSALKQVAREEYAALMRDAVRRNLVGKEVADFFGSRLEQVASPSKDDLRVTIAWNTDATDVDLWVIEPDGTKVFYSHNRSASGGELSQDQTQGYGPERYRIASAQPGTYRVLVHHFRPNANLLGGETHVHVTVTRFAGTPREVAQRHTVILKKRNEEVEVCTLKF
jgi:hypothetical protein